MKIAYCLNSINYVGGIENVTVTKANVLAKREDYEVFIIVSDHEENEGVAAGLSDSVHLIDLDINYYSDDWKSIWNVLKGILVKRRLHKKRLAKTLNEINPEVVISLGQAEKYMLPQIKGRWVLLREMHYCKDFRGFAAASRSVFYKITARLSDFYDYRCKISEYNHIVVLTHEDRRNNWDEDEKVSVIPNPITFRYKTVASLNSRKIIAVGRLTAQKNFSSLIRAFSIVAKRHPDWSLEIYGDGNERRTLQNLIGQLHLENRVSLCGSTRNVQDKMCASSIFVLSSMYEGLPLVMLEAMSCGLPVVSYDCPCGPKDIITDAVDGFLVPTGDERMLAEKICRLIEKPQVRSEMGAAAFAKSENYCMDKIIPMWRELFERLVAEKRGKC